MSKWWVCELKWRSQGNKLVWRNASLPHNVPAKVKSNEVSTVLL